MTDRGGGQAISTRDCSASDLIPQRIESPSLSGCWSLTGAPFRQSPFLPWLVIHQRSAENVNRACTLEIVGWSGSTSSTVLRPARAPDIEVSAMEEPVTSRSRGIAG